MPERQTVLTGDFMVHLSLYVKNLQSVHKRSLSHTNSFPTLNETTPLYIHELLVVPINKQKHSYFCFNLEYNEIQDAPEVSVD